MWEELTPPYATIVVDPPWHYPGAFRSVMLEDQAPIQLPYSTMTLEDIQALPVAELAADTRLFLWTTNHHLRHAWPTMEAWGFTPQRVLVWCKEPMGTGQVTTEFVLVGKKGSPPRMPWQPTTWYSWPRQPGHSRKPPGFYDLVEVSCPGPYVDLFSREPRLGWDSWGWGYET